MAAAPSIQQEEETDNSAQFMECYTANGALVSIFAPFGVCPLGFFSKPPETTDAFSEGQTEDAFDDEVFENDEDEGVSQQENSVICHSPCMILSGSNNQHSQSVSVISGVCPPSHPYYTKPTCTIPEDVEALMESYQAQIDALSAEIDGARSSEQVRDLTAQLEALKAQLEASEGEEEESVTLGGGGGMYFPPPLPPLPPEQPKQAGFGNIPNWAIIGGITLVAIIMIISSKRQQPVVVKG